LGRPRISGLLCYFAFYARELAACPCLSLFISAQFALERQNRGLWIFWRFRAARHIARNRQKIYKTPILRSAFQGHPRSLNSVLIESVRLPISD